MKIGDLFARRLHERFMQPAGYKKKSHTFSRSHADFEEHYNIQGSAWNSAGEAWRFYVNCGISFPGLEVLSPGSGMWKYHAHTRLPALVPKAPAHYDVIAADVEDVVAELGEALRCCSDYLARRHQILRDSYVARRFECGFPYDPEIRKG